MRILVDMDGVIADWGTCPVCKAEQWVAPLSFGERNA